ncbi:MAG: ATP synthase F1 subunit gamma [Candidatus Izemoplasmatales bacterium]|nr:ATP synthase F1 subunit gamma [Candidatus Izemoplasmatales bacterium]
MAALREIKNRIEATKKTSQITKAMNMVSASKLRKVEKKYRAFQPIKEKLKGVLQNILRSNPDVTHPLLKTREIKKTGYILVTSDRGLAGPYNANVFKYFHKILEERHPKKDDFIVGTIGFRGFSWVKRNKYPLLNRESINSRDEVQFIDFQAMSRAFIDLYLEEQVDKIVIVYSHYINTMNSIVQEETLLPLHDLIEGEDKLQIQYLFEPSPEKVAAQLLPIYLENTLDGIILDAKTSEHASRMTAMKSATDNAIEVISKQTLTYNRARQAAITKELTDIIGGANAVK